MNDFDVNNPLFVASVAQAFRILQTFSSGQQYLSLTELTQMTGMNKSAVQRFTYTLEALGYLHKSSKTRCYRLTPKAMDITYSYLRSTPLIEIATPRIVDFRNRFGLTVNVSVLDGTDIVYILRIPSHQQILTATLIGRRVDAFCSSGGRVMLSKLPEDEYTKIIDNSTLEKRTPYTIIDRKEILQRIKTVKEQGYDTNNQECIVGEIVIGAAILSASGKPIAAIHIPVSARDWSEERLKNEISHEVIALAQSIHHP